MTSNSDYIMLYGTNPGLGLQPVLSLSLSPREDGRRPSSVEDQRKLTENL